MFLQPQPGNQWTVNTELSSYSGHDPPQASLQDVSSVTCRNVHHSRLPLLWLWECRDLLEFKAMDLTFERNTVFTAEPSIQPAVSLPVCLCYFILTKVKVHWKR